MIGDLIYIQHSDVSRGQLIGVLNLQVLVDLVGFISQKKKAEWKEIKKAVVWEMLWVLEFRVFVRMICSTFLGYIILLISMMKNYNLMLLFKRNSEFV